MKETGGPAYQELGNVGYNSDWRSESAMTLRDYFAGQALIACINKKTPIDSFERICSEAYYYADGMLKEREED